MTKADAKTPPKESHAYVCWYCGRVFRSANGRDSHQRACTGDLAHTVASSYRPPEQS